MLIKILYIIFIFLCVRLVINSMKKYKQISQKKTSATKQDDDVIDAEYRVVEDNDNR